MPDRVRHDDYYHIPSRNKSMDNLQDLLTTDHQQHAPADASPDAGAGAQSNAP